VLNFPLFLATMHKKTSGIFRLRYCAMSQSQWSYTGARKARNSVITFNYSAVSGQIPANSPYNEYYDCLMGVKAAGAKD